MSTTLHLFSLCLICSPPPPARFLLSLPSFGSRVPIFLSSASSLAVALCCAILAVTLGFVVSAFGSSPLLLAGRAAAAVCLSPLLSGLPPRTAHPRLRRKPRRALLLVLLPANYLLKYLRLRMQAVYSPPWLSFLVFVITSRSSRFLSDPTDLPAGLPSVRFLVPAGGDDFLSLFSFTEVQLKNKSCIYFRCLEIDVHCKTVGTIKLMSKLVLHIVAIFSFSFVLVPVRTLRSTLSADFKCVIPCVNYTPGCASAL